MTQGKHTCGPWKVVAGDDYMVFSGATPEQYPHRCKGDDLGGFVAQVGNRGDAHGWYDARLIAAAPDLLGELKRMVEHFEVFASDHSMEASTETWSALHCAKAAIAKAGSPLDEAGTNSECPSQRFAKALTELPKLAAAAGCYVGIKVYASKADCDKAEGRS